MNAIVGAISVAHDVNALISIFSNQKRSHLPLPISDMQLERDNKEVAAKTDSELQTDSIDLASGTDTGSQTPPGWQDETRFEFITEIRRKDQILLAREIELTNARVACDHLLAQTLQLEFDNGTDNADERPTGVKRTKSTKLTKPSQVPAKPPNGIL